jgi:hypothetical protein
MSQAFLIAYTLIALAVIRPIAGHFAWSWHHASVARSSGSAPHPYPSDVHWSFAVALAALLGAVWPVVAIWTLSAVLGPVGAERREYLHARRKHLDARERHVADLEATLDLQGDR